MRTGKWAVTLAIAAILGASGAVAAAERGGPVTSDRDISQRGNAGVYTGNAGAGRGTGTETRTDTDSAGTNSRGLTAGSGSDTGTTETSRGTSTGVIAPGTGTDGAALSGGGGALEQD